MANTSKIQQIRILSCALCITLVCGCQNKESIAQNNQNNLIADSIPVWIAQGKNDNFPYKLRERQLKKAYNASLIFPIDSLKTLYFLGISYSYLKIDDSIHFRKTNKMAMQWAEKTKDSNILAASHWDLASFFRDNAIEDSAYYHFSKAQKIYSKLHKDFNTARMLYNMAIIQNDIKDYTGSEITIVKAIEILKPLNKYEQLYNCYNNLATLSNALQEYDQALAYHQEAFGYLKKMKHGGNLELGTLNNIGIVYEGMGQYQKAITHFKKLLATDSLRIKDPKLYAKALDNLTYNRFKLKDTAQVEIELKSALNIRDSIGDLSGQAVSHYNLAEYYLSKKDTVLAFTQAKQAMTFSKASSNYKRLLQTLELLPQIDPKNALAYTKEYMALNDSLQQEERQIRNKFERIRYETDEIIEKNELLARQKQLFLGIAIGLFLLGSAILIIISQRIKNQRLKHKQQQQENDQKVFSLMLTQKGKLEEGKHLEQKRVSQELHDGILGQMLGIRLVLSGLNNKTDEKAMDQRAELIKKLQEVEEEVRTISHELNDASYQKIHNFMHSIKELIDTFGTSTGLSCHLDYEHEMDWDRLTGDLKINIYRIIQESLQNCVKYAQAKNITVKFEQFNDLLHISVEDDGIGFNIGKEKRGIGLKNINSRTKKIGGSWSIKSKIGIGTKVSVDIPMQIEFTNNIQGSKQSMEHL